MQYFDYKMVNLRGIMTSKIASILAIIFFSTAALASEEVAFEYSYILFNNRNGQEISQGKVSILANTPTKVEIDNSASGLGSFIAYFTPAFTPTNPDGGIDWFKLNAKKPHFKKVFFNQGEERITFGDRKVFGIMELKKTFSHYFQKADGSVQIYGYDLYKNTVSQDGTCVGGNLEKAANVLDAYHIIESTTSTTITINNPHPTAEGVSWENVETHCIVMSEETTDHGTTICSEWSEPVVTPMSLPRCSN